MKEQTTKRRRLTATGLQMRLRSGHRAQGGFTLVELLIVIVIIAILAAIAIPTFLGQRQNAQDAAAYSLVRNALTAMQGAFVDTGDYLEVATGDLSFSEPSISWIQSDDDLVTTTPAWISPTAPAAAERKEVAFHLESPTVVDLVSVSESGNSFGIQIDVVDISDTGYVKVKVIEGTALLGW